MAQLAAGEVFTGSSPGKTVTATRLNNHVNGATILPGFMAAQAAATPVLADFALWGNAAGTTINKVTLTNLFGIQVVDAAEAIGSLRTIGLGAQQAANGNFRSTDNTFSGLQTFRHIRGTPGSASITPNANLGVGGTATLQVNASDLTGLITLTPAGTPALGVQAAVSFTTNFGTVPQIILVPYNQAAISAYNGTKSFQVTTPAIGGFNISTLAALTAGTVYSYSYIVLGIT